MLTKTVRTVKGKKGARPLKGGRTRVSPTAGKIAQRHSCANWFGGLHLTRTARLYMSSAQSWSVLSANLYSCLLQPSMPFQGSWALSFSFISPLRVLLAMLVSIQQCNGGALDTPQVRPLLCTCEALTLYLSLALHFCKSVNRRPSRRPLHVNCAGRTPACRCLGTVM